jgi:hypothetical protein
MTALIIGTEFERFCQEEGKWNPELVATVTLQFEEIIYASFLVDNSTQTKDEVKRRLNILARWWKVLRYDLKWSQARIKDHLPEALRFELDGKRWEPPREGEKTWVSSDNPFCVPE